jgi:hypothetical protein
MSEKTMQVWDLWYPKAGATGLPFARGRIDPTDVLLVHSLPPVITVTIYENGNPVAEGKDLAATQESPITRLTRNGKVITREDIWPDEIDLGKVILLPGGEAGILKAWWNAADHSEWRWQVEFYNHR